MKTNEVSTGAVSVLGGLPPERKGTDAAPPAGPADRATLAEMDHLRASVSTSVGVAASERPERIHNLTQQVRSGVYRPNSSQLADQILSEAEFDARLVNTLS
jgi:anti-sigma28 factor (negative regulator of flagellin synthesis)